MCLRVVIILMADCVGLGLWLRSIPRIGIVIAFTVWCKVLIIVLMSIVTTS